MWTNLARVGGGHPACEKAREGGEEPKAAVELEP